MTTASGQTRRPGRGWKTCGATMLLVAVLGVCLTAAAEATPSAPPICTAVKGEELSASKAPVSLLWAAVTVADPVLQTPLPSRRLLPERITPRTPSDLRGDLASRAPPTQL